MVQRRYSASPCHFHWAASRQSMKNGCGFLGLLRPATSLAFLSPDSHCPLAAPVKSCPRRARADAVAQGDLKLDPHHRPMTSACPRPPAHPPDAARIARLTREDDRSEERRVGK